MYKCTLFDKCLNQDSCMSCMALSDVQNHHPLYRDRDDPVYKKGYADGRASVRHEVTEQRMRSLNMSANIGGWIPVEKMLPHVHERVLVVCTNPQNHMQEHVTVCTYFGRWHPCNKIRWSGHKQVTHWMPLPEIPSMFEKGGD